MQRWTICYKDLKVHSNLTCRHVTTCLFLICILRENLTFRYNLVDMQSKYSQFQKLQKRNDPDLRPIRSRCLLSVNKTQTKCNDLSNSSTVTFPLPFTAINQLNSTACPPTLPSCSFSLQIHSCASIFFSLHSHSRKEPSISFNETWVHECQGYSRLLSVLPPLSAF